jgi:hypothetical protein
MGDDQTSGFYGILGRVRFEDDRATLRFGPFGFVLDTESKPVLEVVFQQPDFDAKDVERFIGEEVDVDVSSVPAQIEHVFSGETQQLAAREVRAQWQSHDMQDYVDRIAQLEAHSAQDWKETRDLRLRLGKAESFAAEMLRRAEIKAGVSAEHARLQGSAITVLNQMLNVLKDDETAG